MIKILLEKFKFSNKLNSFPATPDLKKKIESKEKTYIKAGQAIIKLNNIRYKKFTLSL